VDPCASALAQDHWERPGKKLDLIVNSLRFPIAFQDYPDRLQELVHYGMKVDQIKKNVRVHSVLLDFVLQRLPYDEKFSSIFPSIDLSCLTFRKTKQLLNRHVISSCETGFQAFRSIINTLYSWKMYLSQFEDQIKTLLRIEMEKYASSVPSPQVGESSQAEVKEIVSMLNKQHEDTICKLTQSTELAHAEADKSLAQIETVRQEINECRRELSQLRAFIAAAVPADVVPRKSNISACHRN
jgi:hypothetical protein